MSREAFSRPGFTVIEMIVVLAIFILSAAVTLPFLGTFPQTEDLETISVDALLALRRAQSRTMSGQRDSSWGVHFQVGGFTLFAGESFEKREVAFDEAHVVPVAYSFTGLTTVRFVRPHGLPIAAGTLFIAHPSNVAAHIDVNAAGAIFLEDE